MVVAHRRDLPVGTLTFLMTDIEGSTPLWEMHPEAMHAAILRHNALFDELLGDYGGLKILERGEGDSVFAVFVRPTDALAAACALQLAMQEEPWPDGLAIMVRMGLHIGEAELHEGSYYGAAINRTARIRSLGAGGQILASRTTNDLVQDALPSGIQLCSLGTHALRGLLRSEEIFQVCHPRLRAQFPPLPTAQAIHGNLPHLLTSFVGRQQACEQIREQLAGARLVTLVGPGGCGKTRLALEVATAAAEALAASDGVWLVELAALTDESLIVPTVGAVLGAGDSPHRGTRLEPLAALAAALAEKELLLVLDNCEHLIGASARLAGALLRACPRVRILATSREALGISGEVPWRVASLALPPRAGSTVEIEQAEAVQLFMQRARTARPGFALTERNVGAVGHICRRLDGIPLALELAAARLSSLSIEALTARLDDRFRLLTGGSRTALERQQTLRATLDWSYALLSAAERTVLCRLSVFAGGWVLEVAETVCAGDGVAEEEVLDLLSGLVNKSLVIAEEVAQPGEGQTRYWLLETVRQYANERLGPDAAVRERLRAYYLALAERAEPELHGPHQDVWLHRLEWEHDNLRAVLASCDETEAGITIRLRIATAISHFWLIRNRCREGQHWLEGPLPERVPPALKARVLMQLGMLVSNGGDLARGIELVEQSGACYRALDDRASTAAALSTLGELVQSQGDCARAKGLFGESLRLYRTLEDRRGIAAALRALGSIAYELGQYDSAVAHTEEGLALFRRLGAGWYIASCCALLGQSLGKQGHEPRSRAYLEESLAIFTRLGATVLAIRVQCSLAAMASDQGDFARAMTIIEHAYTLGSTLEGDFVLGMVRATHGSLARLQGNLPQATLLLEQSLAVVRQLGLIAGAGAIQHELGLIACLRGEYAHAGAFHRATLAIAAERGYRHLIVLGLEGLAAVLIHTGQAERAARLLGVATALREALGTPLPPVERPAYEALLGAASAECGAERFEKLRAAGAAMALDDAVACALDGTDLHASPPDQ